jgi:replicative DNA helicase
MTSGLKLLRAVVDSGDVTLIRQLGESFFIEEEQESFEFVRSHFSEHGRLPSVGSCLENRVTLPTIDETFEYYLSRCKDRAVFNITRDAVSNLSESLKSRNPDDMIGAFRTALNDIGEVRSSYEFSSLAEEALNVRGLFAEAKMGQDTRGITLGWPTLDDVTLGLRGGDLIVVVGRPSMGKSYALLNMAHSAWNSGKSSLFVSMEMTLEQITRRWIALISKTNPRLVALGQLSHWGEELFHQSIDSIADKPPVHFLAGNFKKTVEDIQEAVRFFDPDIVYVDAAYLLGTRMAFKSSQARWEKTTEVVEGLKMLAGTLNKPVVITVQFNRTVAKKSNKDLDLGSIAGADSIPQIASVVMGLQLGDGVDGKDSRKITLMKHREGEDERVININYKFNPLDFSEMEDTDEDGVDLSWVVAE